MMAELAEKAFFTVNLPTRCRAKLDDLGGLLRWSRPQVIEALIELATPQQMLNLLERQSACAATAAE